MIDHLPAAEILETMQQHERIAQSQRGVRLIVPQGSGSVTVCARQDPPSRMLSMVEGAPVTVRAAEFVVVRCDLAEPPPIGATLRVEGRAEPWRLQSIDSGDSPLDPVWTFVCTAPP